MEINEHCRSLGAIGDVAPGGCHAWLDVHRSKGAPTKWGIRPSKLSFATPNSLYMVPNGLGRSLGAIGDGARGVPPDARRAPIQRGSDEVGVSAEQIEFCDAK